MHHEIKTEADDFSHIKKKHSELKYKMMEVKKCDTESQPRHYLSPKPEKVYSTEKRV